MKICGISKPKKYDAIAAMLRDGGSRCGISKKLHVHKDIVRVVDLMMRAEAGDTSVHDDLRDLAERRRQHNGTGKLIIGGMVVKTVEPYRCPDCGVLVKTLPCLACLARSNKKTPPTCCEISEPIQYELEPEQEAIRAEIFSKRGKECVDPILECGGEGAGSSAPLSRPVSQDASCI